MDTQTDQAPAQPDEPTVTSAEPAEPPPAAGALTASDVAELEQWKRESAELAAIPANVLTECGVRNGMSRAEILERCRGRY